MATKPKKKVIKKGPARDLKPGDMRSQILKTGKPQAAGDLRSTDPKSLRNRSLREANRVARKPKPSTALTVKKETPVTTTRSASPSGKGGAPKGTPRLSSDATPKRLSGPSTAVKAAGIGSKILKVGGGSATALTSIVNPSFMNYKSEATLAAEAAADKPSGPLMKGNRLAEGRTDTGRRVEDLKYSEPIGPKKPKAPIMPKASMSGGGVNKPSAGGEMRKKGAGTYTKSYDVDKKKSAPTSKAATAAAAPKRTRPETKYERNSLAMEQRKSSGSSPRKSILSLFKKG